MAQEVVEEYTASLADLTFNSKPLINMLTMLAEDNAQYSEQIVQVIEAHMQKVSADKKLPALYLMDSIMKNVRQSNYLQLFAKNIVNNFVRVFEKVDEKRRQAMFKLRQTWADICPAKKLYALDVRVNQIDPAWPVTAPLPEKSVANIHINPRFLMKKEQDEEDARQKQAEEVMRQQLLSKQQELLQLQQKRLELELATARSQLQQQAEQSAQTVLPAVGAAQSHTLQVLPLPEVETIPAVNHFTPQALVTPQPSTAPLTIPTTARVNQQDPRLARDLARDPRLANRDPRSSAPPQWQTAVVHPAVQSKPQEGQALPVVLSSSSDESVLSSSKSDISLGTMELKDEKTKKPAEKTTEKLVKMSNEPSAKKEDENAPTKIEQKPDKNVPKKDDKPSTSAPKAVEGVQKVTSSTTSSHEKRISRASTSHSRSRSHAGDRTKEKDSKGNKDAKAKSSKDDARSRSRSPRSTRLPREHPDYDRRYNKRASVNADRRRRSHEHSPTDKKETMSLRSGEKHKLGRGNGHPLEARAWKGKVDRAHMEVTGGKVTDNRDTGPAAKRLKRQENSAPANEKHEALSDDLADLFGKEDKDYRMMGPPVTPKLDIEAARAARNSVDLVLPSPKQEEWKRFKESRPGDFPFVQPRSSAMDVDIRSRDVDLRQPMLSPPGCGMGSMRRPYMPRIPKVMHRDEGKDLVIPRQLRLDQEEIVLRQAEEQVKLGTLSRAEHQDLKLKLKRLYILQKIQQDGPAEMDMNRPPHGRFNGPNTGYFDDRGNVQKRFWGPGPPRHGRNEERMGSPARFMEGANSPHHDTDERRSNRAPLMPTPHPENDFVEGPNMKPPQRPLNNGPGFEHDSEMGFRGGRPFPQTDRQMPLLPPPLPPLPGHAHQQPLLQSPSNNPQDPSREFSFTDKPWYNTDRHYVFEHDERWMMRVRQHFDNNKSTEVVIDGKSYRVTNNRPRVVHIGNEHIEVRLDLDARRVFVGQNISYLIGSPEIMETINGQRHQIHFRGPIKRLWIDGHQFELWLDAPPEKVTIANVEYSMQLNSMRGVVLVNDNVVCPLSEQPQIINLGNSKHEIHFNQPSKQILIDGKLCELNFTGKFPVVIMNGKAHGIRFDGGQREILVNGRPWTVSVDKPRKARLAGPRPYLIALGGPGHEVIIDDQWCVVKFNGPEVFFTIGYRKFRLQLKGSAPEVKILGEVITPEQAVKIYGPNPMQPMPPRQVLAPPHGMVEPGCNEPGFRPGGGPPFPQINDRFGPQGRPGFPSPHHDDSFQGRRNNSVPSLLDMDVKPSMAMKNEPHLEGPPHGEPGFGQPPRGPGPEFTGGPRPNLMGQPRLEEPHGPFPDIRPNMGMGGLHDGPRPPFIGPMSGVDQSVRPMMGDMNTNGPAGMMPGHSGMMPNQGGMMPNQGGMMPNQGGMMPNQIGMMPNQGGMMLNQGNIMPNQGGMMQNQGGMPPLMSSQQQPMPGNQVFLQTGGMVPGGMQMGSGSVPGQMPNMGGMNYMQQPQQMITGATPGSAIPGMMPGQGGAVPQLQPMNSQVDVDDLLTKLMAAGIINESKAEVKAEVKAEKEVNEKTLVKEEIKKVEEVKFEDVPDLSDFDIQKMKTCYNGVLQRLYTGIQCSSCGVRFMAADTEQYREHLDWHFRQNRKEKEEIKVAKFRRWYYAAADWIQFEEIGDAEENAQSNYFENMMQLAQEQQGFGSLPGQTELISCPAALGNEKDDVCAICGDPFEQFWDEEQEAWHLKDAIRVSGETYHPVCYEDAKESGLAEGLTTPDAQQQQQEQGGQQQQQQQQQQPPDPITNPLAYLNMLNQQKQSQKQQDCAATVPATAVTVAVKQEPMDTCQTGATIMVTVISSAQPTTMTTAVQGTPVKCDNVVPTTICVGQSSSTDTATSLATASTSQETATKQTDSTGTGPVIKTEPTDVPKS